jgi:soluble lytic murein transglycosylase-like protein
MMLAGAAFFSPHAGKAAPAKRNIAPTSMAAADSREPVATVTTSESFSLSPKFDYDAIIAEAADRYRLDPALIRAVIRTESGFDPLAVSTAGAQGLMQLMPALARELGVEDSFDPRENVMAGCQYLSALLAYYNGDVQLALASYNAGPGMVERYNGIPPFEETQRYVKTIIGLIEAPAPQKHPPSSD